MKKPIIEFKNVSKVFEDSNTKVLKDINFELEEGKFYTLLGASGSGKSTILNIIAGLLGSSVGQALFGKWGPTMAGMSLIPSILGAVIVIAVVSFFFGRRG